MSPIPNFDDEVSESEILDSNIQKHEHNVGDHAPERSLRPKDNKTIETMEGKCMDDLNSIVQRKSSNELLGESIFEPSENDSLTDPYDPLEATNGKLSPKLHRENVHRVQSGNAINLGMGDVVVENVLPRDTSNDALSEARVTSNMTQIAHIDPEQCGLPLNLFTKVSSYISFFILLFYFIG